MNKGFTIIEYIIYLAIIGLMASAFIMFSVSAAGPRNKTYSFQETQSNNREVLHAISSAIRQADSINGAASVFGSHPGVLTLNYASPPLDPTVISLVEESGTMQIKQGSSDPVNITSEAVMVTNLIFTDLSTGSKHENVRFEVMLEYASASDQTFRASQSFQSSAGIRK